jgi:xylulokinase
MAGVGVGLFHSLSEIRKWVRYTHHITPNPQVTALYEPLYRIYRELYNQTRGLMRDLSALDLG